MNKIFIYFIALELLFAVNCSNEKVISPNNPPIVLILNPNHGAEYSYGDTIVFSGVATDQEDGSIKDSALVWTSDKDGLIGNGILFEKSDLTLNTHLITLTATDSDGEEGSFQISISIYGVSGPSVTIFSPEDHSIYIMNSEIVFSGEALDPEEGVLPENSLIWISDRDGKIGTGTSLAIDDLSVNEHKIKLTATDSEGFTNSDSISISVVDSCWFGPSTPKDVFREIQDVVSGTNNCEYEKYLHEDFAFIPTPEDQLDLGDAAFDGWDKNVEIAFMNRVKEIYLGDCHIQFGDENMVFDREDIDVPATGFAEFEGEYLMTLDPGDGSPVEHYAGRAIFYLEKQTQGWMLTKWEDVGVIGSSLTAGYLRGTLRE